MKKWICDKCGYETYEQHKSKFIMCNNCKRRLKCYIQCKICGNWIRAKNLKKKFCNLECKRKGYIRIKNRKKQGKLLNCLNCNKGFYVPKCRVNIAKYCSSRCWSEKNPYMHMKGIKKPKEWIDKAIIGCKNYYSSHSSPRKDKTYEGIVGKEEALLWKRKLSEASIGKFISPETREKIRKAILGFHPTEETREKLRKRKPNKSWLGKKFTKEMCEKISIKSKKNWQNKEYREKVLKGIAKGLRNYPSSYEKKIIELNNEFNLGYKYCGEGNDIVIIGGKIPDFININGKKILLEVYSKGHLGNKKPLNYEEIRVNIFSKFGYRTIFFNEDDLFRQDWKKHCLVKVNSI